MLNELKKDLKKIQNPKKAKILQSFFKTGVGEYGEGQIFLGINNDYKRKIAKKYLNLGFEDIQMLLNSKFHDERFVGMTLLEIKYKKDRENVVKFYIKNAEKFNNWDLVDLSAYKIMGNWLLQRKDRKILYKFACSKNLWKRRIAIISTFAFIRQNDFEDSIKISRILLKDKEDLIHKAVGWMLREVGKRNQKVLEEFLNKNYKQMPRIMLRYSIEKFPELERKRYLEGSV